jgi:WD40 repeat protein
MIDHTHIDHNSDSDNYTGELTGIPGEYRFVFAVVTLSTVYVYDTQHARPFAKFKGLHYAPINDVAWSEDGLTLVACSSDGYLSFFRFEEGALVGVICPYVIVIELDKMHVIVFLSIFPAQGANLDF